MGQDSKRIIGKKMKNDMYDLSGRKLSTFNSRLSTLRKGIYIWGGRKILLK
jgi:hypothetical protein